MAKIRHIAIKVEDQEKTADFYKKTFGMTEAWRGPVRDDGNRAIYLTDGYINMAVLPARGGREGIDHFGYAVESIEQVKRDIEEFGRANPTAVPKELAGGVFGHITQEDIDACKAGKYAIADPDGLLIDLSERPQS